MLDKTIWKRSINNQNLKTTKKYSLPKVHREIKSNNIKKGDLNIKKMDKINQIESIHPPKNHTNQKENINKKHKIKQTLKINNENNMIF